MRRCAVPHLKKNGLRRHQLFQRLLENNAEHGTAQAPQAQAWRSGRTVNKKNDYFYCLAGQKRKTDRHYKAEPSQGATFTLFVTVLRFSQGRRRVRHHTWRLPTIAHHSTFSLWPPEHCKECTAKRHDRATLQKSPTRRRRWSTGLHT